LKPTKPLKRIPFLVAFGVILVGCFLRWLPSDFFERLELMTFDMRVRDALQFAPPVATNLGFVYIDETSIIRVRDGTFGYKFGLYWPRQVYGRLASELAQEGAKVVGFDVIFGELRPDHGLVQMGDGSFLESDEFFALQLRLASNAVIAVTPDLVPPSLFCTNASATADISTQKDPDGILRRARAFRYYRDWHAAFKSLEHDPEYGVNLRNARVETNRIVLSREGMEAITIPLNEAGEFDVADFWGESLPEGMPRHAKPFIERRVWHMGIVLAARVLGLDLDHADVRLDRGEIVLKGPDLTRVIPVDSEGHFYIDWSLPLNHPWLAREPAHQLLWRERQRLDGKVEAPATWLGKLVVVGSSALANDLSDRGATPLSSDTLLASKHWNVANSLLLGRFVRRSSLWVDLALISTLAMLAALLTWNLRALTAALAVFGSTVIYIFIASLAYRHTLLWLPLAIPVMVSMVTTHLSLLSWRVFFEQAERRRIRSVFSKMVSPKIVNELLASDTLSLGGSRREISVLFADMRGFTEWTDRGREQVALKIRAEGLDVAAAEAHHDQQAREVLTTINVYLGLVADVIKRHEGVLDKYIGDCVMAFWGAPLANPQHAVMCVRAAVALQREIHGLNMSREAENQRRKSVWGKGDTSQTALSPLPILNFGTGVNTGLVTAGLMGSAEAESMNYTVFGRDVNVASRLEGASGHSRIFIGQTTYEHLRRDAPNLAAMCVELGPMQLKGFAAPIQVFEVCWQSSETREPELADASIGARPPRRPEINTAG
jgi:class 3 adenylate cyclase/CHASE2 domain-containing sensor protein